MTPNLFQPTGFSKVYRALKRKPWQTEPELRRLLGYHGGKTMLRLMRMGIVRRRVSNRRLMPYEYALVERS